MNMIAINVCDDGTARTIKAQYYKNSAANLSSKGGVWMHRSDRDI